MTRLLLGSKKGRLSSITKNDKWPHARYNGERAKNLTQIKGLYYRLYVHI